MKIQVYCPEKVESEKVVTLRLIESGNSVLLAVVDKDGNAVPNGFIGHVGSEGVLTIYKGLDPETGLQCESDTSGIVVRFN